MRWLPWRPAAPGPLPARPDCGEVARVVQAFLDGELRPQDAEAVASHLQACDRCGLDAEVMRQVIAAIRRQRPDLDPGLLTRLSGSADDLDRPGSPSADDPDGTG